MFDVFVNETIDLNIFQFKTNARKSEWQTIQYNSFAVNIEYYA